MSNNNNISESVVDLKIMDRMVAESLLMLRHDINLLKRLVCELKDMSENERISIECMKDMDFDFQDDDFLN